MTAPKAQPLSRRALLLSRLVFHALMWFGVWLMVSASVSYAELGQAHPFLLEKLPLARPHLYWAAVCVHVPSALFALPACLLLMSSRLRQWAPRFHRRLGRLTGLLILCAVVPSGMYLACFAQGGLLTTLGFWLTGLITFFAMLMSIVSARRRDLRAHRRFSSHVLAQLAVAVLSRFLLVGAEALGWYDETVYTAALFVPVIGGLLVAELCTGRRSPLPSKGTRHETFALASHPHVVR